MRRSEWSCDRDHPLPQGAAQRRTLTAVQLWLAALVWVLGASGAVAGCRLIIGAQLPPPAYEICPLSKLPPVFSEPELSKLFAGLAPGQSLQVSGMFLRVAAPWPYLDIRGPGAASGGNMPNPPRAVFLLRADHPAVEGPLLLVAPAGLQHQLRTTPDGGLPRDSWRITDGPFAPTLYGRLHRGGRVVNFSAQPTADSAASGRVGAAQRARLIVKIVDFFVSE